MKRLIFIPFLVLAAFCANSQELSLEQKAARMLIVGFRGTEINSQSAVVKDIVERGVGGVILFEHNITPVEKKLDSRARLKVLCEKLQALTSREIIISIDQEGGKVNRLKSKYGFPVMVSQQKLGEIDNEDSTRYYSHTIASELKQMGFNTNFTPCVDVNIDPKCPVIGKVQRSFSANPAKVIEHSLYVIDEHKKEGIKTAVKHFPGHGSSAIDSHLGFTDVTDTWQASELEPYKVLLNNGSTDMVMLSHVFNKNIDDTYPATLSYKTVTGLLRQELGWQGIAVTDDMHMKAIADNYSLEESLMLTINAGIDLIILSSNIPGNLAPISEQAISAIVKLVKEGKIAESRLDESIARVNKVYNN